MITSMILIIHRKAKRTLIIAIAEFKLPQKLKSGLHICRLKIVSKGTSRNNTHKGMIIEVRIMAKVEMK